MHSFRIEKTFLDQGYDGVIGVDEAGRGPLAGPVVAASFLFAEPIARFASLSGVDDSKKMTERKRLYIYDTLIAEFADHLSYAAVDHLEIDRLNIFRATMLAMSKSLESLEKPARTMVLVDGNHLIPGVGRDQQAVIKGDAKVFAIAAASIVAKVVRDKMMESFDKEYPQYGFAKHKGYGTKEHLNAIARHGACPIHRRSYAPIKNCT